MTEESAAVGFHLSGREPHLGNSVARHRDVPVEMHRSLGPVARQLPVRGAVGCRHMIQLLNREIRAQHNLPITRLHRIHSGEVAVIPRNEVAEHHHVVATVHLARCRVAVPQFPYRGRTLFNHVAVARIGCSRSEQIGDIAASHARQLPHEPVNAYHAAAHMATVGGENSVYKVLLHLLAARIGHHVKCERQYISRHGVVAVKHAVGVKSVGLGGKRCATLHGQETLVERLLHRRSIFKPSARIVVSADNPRELGEQVRHLIIVSRCDECLVGFPCRISRMDELGRFRRHTPVAILVGSYKPLFGRVIVTYVPHPLLYGCIVALYRLHIAGLPVKHIAHHRKCRGPSHVGSIIIVERRAYIRDAAVFTLRLANVIGPLGIETTVVEEEVLAPRAHIVVAGPRLTLVALRTVDRHALIVGGYATPRIGEHLIQHAVGAFEISGIVHLVIYHLGDNIACIKTRHSGDLNEAEAMIRKAGAPPGTGILTRGYVSVGAQRMAQILHVEVKAVGSQQFGITHSHGVAR